MVLSRAPRALRAVAGVVLATAGLWLLGGAVGAATAQEETTTTVEGSTSTTEPGPTTTTTTVEPASTSTAPADTTTTVPAGEPAPPEGPATDAPEPPAPHWRDGPYADIVPGLVIGLGFVVFAAGFLVGVMG